MSKQASLLTLLMAAVLAPLLSIAIFSGTRVRQFKPQIFQHFNEIKDLAADLAELCNGANRLISKLLSQC